MFFVETGRPMLISHHEGIKRTFSEINDDVNRIAKAMHEDLGLKHGDVVGLWSCNTYNWVSLMYRYISIYVEQYISESNLYRLFYFILFFIVFVIVTRFASNMHAQSLALFFAPSIHIIK